MAANGRLSVGVGVQRRLGRQSRPYHSPSRRGRQSYRGLVSLAGIILDSSKWRAPVLFQERPLLAQPTHSASVRFLAHRSRSSRPSIRRCPRGATIHCEPLNVANQRCQRCWQITASVGGCGPMVLVKTRGSEGRFCPLGRRGRSAPQFGLAAPWRGHSNSASSDLCWDPILSGRECWQDITGRDTSRYSACFLVKKTDSNGAVHSTAARVRGNGPPTGPGRNALARHRFGAQ
jgi:hypothetical protein